MGMLLIVLLSMSWILVPSDQVLARHYFLEQLNKPEYIWGIRAVCVVTAVVFFFLYKKLKGNMTAAEAIVSGGRMAMDNSSEDMDDVPVIEIDFAPEPVSAPETESALGNVPAPVSFQEIGVVEEPLSVSQPEAVVMPVPEPESEVVVMPVADPEPEINVMPVSEPEVAVLPEPESVSEPESTYEPQIVPIYGKVSASKTALESVLEFVPASKSVLELKDIPAPKSVLEQEDIPELKFVSERSSITKHVPKKEAGIKPVVKRAVLPKVPELNTDSNSLLWAVVGVSVSVSVSVSLGSLALLSAYRKKRRVA